MTNGKTYLEASIDYIKQKLHDLCEEIDDLKKDNKETYVTKTEFTPIKQLVYGAVAIILTAVLSALVYLVVKGG